MAENNSDTLLKGAYNGSGFKYIYYDGADISGSDQVTDIVKDIVSSTDRDYLFRCVVVQEAVSQYELVLCDDLSLSGNTFSCGSCDVFRFTASISHSYSNVSQTGTFTFDGQSGSISFPSRRNFVSVNIVPKLTHQDSYTYSDSASEFYYSSLTIPVVDRTSKEGVNLLACIAFILAVLGCSLWFAAIFRNVQRR